METGEAILKRRIIRKYLDEEVDEELLYKLVEAGYSAPSACNKKPFNIYVVTNKEKILLLNKSGMFTRMNSPVIIIVAGVLSRGLPGSLKQYWIQDCAAVTQNILIKATSLGLGSCWNGLYPQEKVSNKVKNILSLDDDIVPLSLIHIGYSNENKECNSGFDQKRVFFIK